MRASVFTLTLLCSLPLYAESNDDLDVLRARSTEQERQIRNLETEIESLHSQLALERRRAQGRKITSPPVVIPSRVDSRSYIVSTGDTLSSIARKHEASVGNLMKLNSIEDPSHLQAGQRIILSPGAETRGKTPFFKKTPPKAIPVLEEEPKIKPAKGVPEVKTSPDLPKNYKVERGDTLYGIARRHGVSIEKLRSLNPDIQDRILVGQRIAVVDQGRLPSSGTTRKKAGAVTPSTMQEKPSLPAETITYKPIKTSEPLAPKPSLKAPSLKESDRPSKPAASAINLKSEKTDARVAPRSISSVFVSEEVTFGDFARRHGTTPEQLNALNGWDFRGSLLLAKGSEIYVPGS